MRLINVTCIQVPNPKKPKKQSIQGDQEQIPYTVYCHVHKKKTVSILVNLLQSSVTLLSKVFLLFILLKIIVIRGGIFILWWFFSARIVNVDLFLRHSNLKGTLANPVLRFDVDIIHVVVLAQEMALKYFDKM
jgi:hypothetical protein